MQGDLQQAVAFLQAVLYGKGDGHTHGKEKGREDDVREAHHVFLGGGMVHPVGKVFYTRVLVYPEHEQHGQRAEYIQRLDSYGFGRSVHRLYVC